MNMPKDIDNDTAHDYWQNFENKVDDFWKGALKIVRKTYTDWLMRELYDHFYKLHSLKIDNISESNDHTNKKINGKNKADDELDDDNKENERL
jgi:hypothetical protein